MSSLFPYRLELKESYNSVILEFRLLRYIKEITNLDLKELINLNIDNERFKLLIQIIIDKNESSFLLRPDVQQRMYRELSVFLSNKEHNIFDFLLYLDDITQYLSVNKIGMRSGMNKINSSLIAYLLKFTSVNPLDYNLLFETWLVDGKKPEIDARIFEKRKLEYFLIEKHGKVFKKINREYMYSFNQILFEYSNIIKLSKEDESELKSIFYIETVKNRGQSKHSLFLTLSKNNPYFSKHLFEKKEVREIFLNKLDKVYATNARESRITFQEEHNDSWSGKLFFNVRISEEDMRYLSPERYEYLLLQNSKPEENEKKAIVFVDDIFRKNNKEMRVNHEKNKYTGKNNYILEELSSSGFDLIYREQSYNIISKLLSTSIQNSLEVFKDLSSVSVREQFLDLNKIEEYNFLLCAKNNLMFNKSSIISEVIRREIVKSSK